MNQEQRQAYEWAKKQSYPSVAARYSKILAGLVDEITQPNEPLTLEELREMSGQPFWDDASSGWWIVAHVDGSKIYTEEGAILDFYEEGEEDVYFRRPPEGEA